MSVTGKSQKARTGAASVRFHGAQIAAVAFSGPGTAIGTGATVALGANSVDALVFGTDSAGWTTGHGLGDGKLKVPAGFTGYVRVEANVNFSDVGSDGTGGIQLHADINSTGGGGISCDEWQAYWVSVAGQPIIRDMFVSGVFQCVPGDLFNVTVSYLNLAHGAASGIAYLQSFTIHYLGS